MIVRRILPLIALSLIVAAPAWAGGVVVRASGCSDYMFVDTGSDFSVLRGDAEGIKDGDRLEGEVSAIGQPLLFDATAGRSVFAQVTELHLTRTEIAQQIAVRCRWPLAEQVVTGSVVRASGCGSKIFVNTPQGYAVLERIAGGIVADGDTLTGTFNRPGRITVHDIQSDAPLIAFVADLWLSRSAAYRKIRQSCRGGG
jgi:hypothetical protein